MVHGIMHYKSMMEEEGWKPNMDLTTHPPNKSQATAFGVREPEAGTEHSSKSSAVRLLGQGPKEKSQIISPCFLCSFMFPLYKV